MTVMQNEPVAGSKRHLGPSSIAVLTLLAALVAEGCSSASEETASGGQPLDAITSLAPGLGCPPHPPAFWRANPTEWPVTSLTLGGTRYTAAQLLAILEEPGGDVRVPLMQQLVAAMLDVASGTDSTLIAGTIASANALLASATSPPDILSPPRLRDLLEAIEDTVLLANFTDGRLTRECGAPPGSCEAWSDVSVLVAGHDVVAYVGNYQFDGVNNTVSGSGISVLDIEGARVTPTVIPTPDTVDSCATNAFTGQTVCSSFDSVYLLSGTTLEATLTGGASSPPGSGEYNQGVVIGSRSRQGAIRARHDASQFFFRGGISVPRPGVFPVVRAAHPARPGPARVSGGTIARCPARSAPQSRHRPHLQRPLEPRRRDDEHGASDLPRRSSPGRNGRRGLFDGVLPVVVAVSRAADVRALRALRAEPGDVHAGLAVRHVVGTGG